MKSKPDYFKLITSVLLLGAVMLHLTELSNAQIRRGPRGGFLLGGLKPNHTINLNTGLVGQAGTTLTAVLQSDDDWQVTADPLNRTVRRATVVNNITPGSTSNWVAPFPDSRWISADPNKYKGVLGPSRTSFTYRACFNLPALFSAPELTLQLRADDIIRNVRLNGTPIFDDKDLSAVAGVGKAGSHRGPPLSIAYTQVTGFRVGVNCVEVTAEDVSQVITGLDVAGAVTYAGCIPPPAGMVAWWPLDEQSGTTVYDIAGGHHGSTKGAAKPNPIGAGGLTPVKGSYVGNSLQFGFNMHLQVPNARDLNFGTGDFTIDAWVMYTKPPTLESIVGKRDMTQSGYTLQIGTPFPTNQPRLQFLISKTTYQGPNITAPVGTWVFVAAVRTGNTVRLYVNNTSLTVTSVATPSASSTNQLQIGYSSPSGSNLAIDEVEIFNRALSEQEILSIFNAGSKGKCKPEKWTRPNEDG